MKSTEVYEKLEKDFVTLTMTDDWVAHMDKVQEFLTENFKQRSMGLVCDFTEDIQKVYTAVFPSQKVMQKILDDNVSDALLFVHHPSIWDIRRAPEIFHQMDKEQLQQFQNRNIAIFNFHVPLDNNGEFSTTVNLAKALDIEVEKEFAPYFGAMCGVFGKTADTNVNELKDRFEKILGHEVQLYAYGDEQIRNQRVSLVAGGGNDKEILEEVVAEGINVHITGITALSDYSRKAHDYAKEHHLNILGGTHYSTERFACEAMVRYFESMGLPAEFVEDAPVMEDM
jgi:putative NIF3 family GTP cyclohydrolase 1 type 2